jgi:hypothetical protein
MKFSCFKRIYWAITERSVYSFLQSKEDHSSEYFTSRLAQKISNINEERIPTYPRITIFNKSVKDKNKQLIFDSSDFAIINKTLGVFDRWNGLSYESGKEITVNSNELIVIRIKVDFLSVFDDYSQPSPLGHRHSQVYEGKDVPYNIQIIIEVKEA